MDIDEIMKLVQAVSDYSLTSLEFEEGNMKISLKREKEAPQIMGLVGAGMELPPIHQQAVVPAAPDKNTGMPAPAAGIASDHMIYSPLVGTYYHSSSPDAEPFVKVGDTVKKGQVMGIIEAMKLMNEIESEFDGVVEAVLVNNEDVVEYGQPLFRIR